MATRRINEHGLNPQQMKFCDILLADPRRNGTQAYLKVYQDVTNPDVAATNASRLLSQAYVKAYLAAQEKKSNEQAGLSLTRWKQEVAAIAFSDMRDFFCMDGTPKRIHELSDAAAAALQNFYISFSRDNNGKPTGEVTIKIKLGSKIAALEQAGRHLGAFESDNSNLSRPIMHINMLGRDPDEIPQRFKDKLKKHAQLLEDTDESLEKV